VCTPVAVGCIGRRTSFRLPWVQDAAAADGVAAEGVEAAEAADGAEAAEGAEGAEAADGAEAAEGAEGAEAAEGADGAEGAEGVAAVDLSMRTERPAIHSESCTMPIQPPRHGTVSAEHCAICMTGGA
jgi:hypothetical protein